MKGDSSLNSSLSRAVPWLAALTAIAWLVASVALFFSGSGERLDSPARYLDNGGFLAGIILTGVALTAIQRGYAVAAGRLGQVGYWLVMLGLTLHAIQDIAALIVGTEEILGPMYPIASLILRLGFLLWGIAVYRHSLLPRWLGPLLALAWLIIPPLTPYPVALVLPAAWACTALALRRPVATRQAAPAL